MKKICTGISWFLVIMVCFNCASCISSKTVTYFNNLPDSARIQLDSLTPPQQYIQVNDVLDIRVGGENEKTVQYLNQYFNSNSSLYTVDLDGNIELPKVGKIKVAALTKDEAKAVITKAYAVYLIDPIVSLKLNNFNYAILGAVNRPGYFNTPNEKVNVFEALAQAGDMSPVAKRNDIRIVRETNGNREVVMLDLNSKDILNSPNFYLRRNDIMYVSAQRIASTTANFSRTATIIASITGILAFVITLIRR